MEQQNFRQKLLSVAVIFTCVFLAFLPPATLLVWNQTKGAFLSLFLSLISYAFCLLWKFILNRKMRSSKNHDSIRIPFAGKIPADRNLFDIITNIFSHPQHAVEQVISLFNFYLYFTIIALVFSPVIYITLYLNGVNLYTLYQLGYVNNSPVEAMLFDLALRTNLYVISITLIIVSACTRYKFGFTNIYRNKISILLDTPPTSK